MGKVYNGQDALKIRLTCSQDITGATVKKIKYKKPSGTEGSWDATVEDEVNGIIYYNFQANDIDETGNWTFWHLSHLVMEEAPQENRLQDISILRVHKNYIIHIYSNVINLLYALYPDKTILTQN